VSEVRIDFVVFRQGTAENLVYSHVLQVRVGTYWWLARNRGDKGRVKTVVVESVTTFKLLGVHDSEHAGAGTQDLMNRN